jgi:hypothetical protein
VNKLAPIHIPVHLVQESNSFEKSKDKEQTVLRKKVEKFKHLSSICMKSESAEKVPTNPEIFRKVNRVKRVYTN